MKLENLSDLIDKCRADYEALPYKSDIQLDEQLNELLSKSLAEIDKSSSHAIHPVSVEFTNSDKLKASVPSSALWYAHTFWKLKEQLDLYQGCLAEIRTSMAKKGHTTGQIKDYLKGLPGENDFNSSQTIASDFRACINAVLPDSSDRSNFAEYCKNKKWWFKPVRESEAIFGKSLDRGDVSDSSLALACGVIVANSAKMLTIIRAFAHSPELRSYFESGTFGQFGFKSSSPASTQGPSKPGENIIFYGAPGTGKSYRIDQFCTDDNSVRAVFHPDTQYSDFAGCLKPRMSGASIVYEFRPGPFALALKLAYQKPDEHIYLIIEEINRAAAAAAFGELFQLLDRDPTGKSNYGISVSDPDMLEYLKCNAPSVIEGNKLRIPGNLSLYATMNSSDQAVMPMDTAFKRRWKFDYIPIDFRKAAAGSIAIPLSDKSRISIKWSDLAIIINDELKENNVPEDRLLGPWFLSENELRDPNSASQSLKGKLLLYIWDDILRHGDKGSIFNSELKTFGELIKSLESGSGIFNPDIEDKLREYSGSYSVTEAPAEPEHISESDFEGVDDQPSTETDLKQSEA